MINSLVLKEDQCKAILFLQLMARFTLGKKERLKSKKQIEQLFTEGKHFQVFPFRVYYLLNKLTDFPLQFATTVSRKIFKKAIDRNRVKRLVREAFRLQKLPLQEKLQEKNLHLNLILVYTDNDLPDFNFMKEKLKLILERLLKIVDENIP